MDPETPNRPFESLEWYREAVRVHRHDDSGGARALSWLKSADFLTVHISAFAIGIVTLLVINLLRSPDDLWVDRAGAAWALLLTIHGVGIGLLWAIGQLGNDDHQALQVIPDREWQGRPGSWPVAKHDPPTVSVTPAAPVPDEGQRGHTAVSAPVRPSLPVTGQFSPPSTGWSFWGDNGGRPNPADDEPKASWKETATWLTRGGQGSPPAPGDKPGDDARPPGGASPR